MLGGISIIERQFRERYIIWRHHIHIMQSHIRISFKLLKITLVGHLRERIIKWVKSGVHSKERVLHHLLLKLLNWLHLLIRRKIWFRVRVLELRDTSLLGFLFLTILFYIIFLSLYDIQWLWFRKRNINLLLTFFTPNSLYTRWFFFFNFFCQQRLINIFLCSLIFLLLF